MAVARQRVVPVELAEAAAEGDVLLARDLLVAEQQDAVLEERAVDLVELGVAERLGEIDALDLGAEGVAQRTEGKRHGDLLNHDAYHGLSKQNLKPLPSTWQNFAGRRSGAVRLLTSAHDASIPRTRPSQG